LGASTNYQLPWPEATDQADGPLGIGNLARRTDDVLLTNIYNPLSSRIATLESVPPVVVPRMVRGRVSAAGGIAQGTGFTPTRISIGQYTIYFATAFPATPALLVTVWDSSDTRCTVRTFTGGTDFGVNIRDHNGVLKDNDFFFLAVAM
jgi:hypothetical protein